MNDYYHSFDKGLHCTKMKKENINCIEKYLVLQRTVKNIAFIMFICVDLTMYMLF